MPDIAEALKYLYDNHTDTIKIRKDTSYNYLPKIKGIINDTAVLKNSKDIEN